jgi:hypothetical protein
LSLFRWIKEIKGITRVGGAGNSLVMHLRSSRISNKDLRELIGIFVRYKFKKMSQLAQFLNGTNQSWFNDPRAYWHRRVFEAAHPRKGIGRKQRLGEFLR